MAGYLGTSNISREQPLFVWRHYPGHAVDTSPLGFAFLIFLILILKLKSLQFCTLALTPQFFRLIPSF